MPKIRHLVHQSRARGVAHLWQPSASLRALGYSTIRLDDDLPTAERQAEEINRRADAERDRQARLALPGHGTLDALMTAYLASPDYQDLRESTRRGYRQCVEWLRQSPLAKSSVKAITPPVVQALKRSMAATPWKANATLRVVRLLFAFGRREGLVTGDNPAVAFRGLKTPARQVVWSHADETAFLSHAEPHQALAYLLGVYTAQREGDLLTLPWSAYDGHSLRLRQSKTGELVEMTVPAALKAALDATERRATVILTDRRGLPWKPDHFRHTFAATCRFAGIKNRRFADLRRTAVVRLAEAGCTPAEIAAVSGHTLDSTTRILETYLPRNTAMASAAIVKLERRTKG